MPISEDPECCGCLNGIIRATVLLSLATNALRWSARYRRRTYQQTLTEMELTLELCSAICPHCGSTNLFPGFSQIMAYTCKECGAGCRSRFIQLGIHLSAVNLQPCDV